MAKIIKQSVTVLNGINEIEILKSLELCGRTCYKSEEYITEDSASKFVSMILKSGHESVLEHINITVRFITDRLTSHQIVRHRLCAFSQESTRYCNYSKDKFGKEIIVILPVEYYRAEVMDSTHDLSDKSAYDEYYMAYNIWKDSMNAAEYSYFEQMRLGIPVETARGSLPQHLKTEINVTTNLRQWRHMLKQRINCKASPQIMELFSQLQLQLCRVLPRIFRD